MMEIVVCDKESIKDIIKALMLCKNIAVNVYYQEIGSISNSKLKNVNTCRQQI